jgi:ketosteroid isomerase-like protein
VGEAADVVRQVHARFNQRDRDGFLALCSKRIVWHEVEEVPGARTYRGPDEVAAWYEKNAELSDDLTLEIWEVEDHGGAALVETSAEMTATGSSAPLGWRFWAVWRVREGRVTYHHGFSRREDARTDLEG